MPHDSRESEDDFGSSGNPPAWFGPALAEARAKDAMTLVRDMIGYMGDNPARDGLKDTPARVVAAWREMFRGYHYKTDDIARMLKTFDCPDADEMIVQTGISFYSTCEHHLLPFHGTAVVAYIPGGYLKGTPKEHLCRVVGISKLARLVDVFARRLQIQERLTGEVTAALDQYLHPKASACIIKATHLCMSCRGVRQADAQLITSSLTGVFRNDVNQARAELLSLIR